MFITFKKHFINTACKIKQENKIKHVPGLMNTLLIKHLYFYQISRINLLIYDEM